MFLQDLSRPFTRIMGCTAKELAGWLERALPGGRLTVSTGDDAGQCRVQFPDGALHIDWVTRPPERIALLEIPQLEVRFTYFDLPESRRLAIQNTFDRATQRGGG
jgi:hypothetical protein